MRTSDEAATVAATSGEARPRIEIVAERRRAHDARFRAMVVAESLRPGVRVRDLARRHGICTSLIYRWRRGAGSGVMADPALRLIPVRIAAPVDERLAGSEAPSPLRARLVRIELNGGVRISVDEEISVTALRRVISVLRE